jgi:hypothetical protein
MQINVKSLLTFLNDVPTNGLLTECYYLNKKDGSLLFSELFVDELVEKMKKNNVKNIQETYNLYQYLDMQMIVSNDESKYFSTKEVKNMISEDHIIILKIFNPIDQNIFPIISDYHNESVVTIKKFVINGININVKNIGNDLNYVYLSFLTNSDSLNNVKTTFEKINDLLKN